ncbi:hypothetical protein D9613_009029 [Agrocybe pediades]|uniref:Uncharacterized protein n=1 Tax=Agrocybe pediades TaxID=84607 RepID=A0A8H4VU38_9AGAR|nr:hypothetical protein D9613_009029 [Agrocybe pediades]
MAEILHNPLTSYRCDVVTWRLFEEKSKRSGTTLEGVKHSSSLAINGRSDSRSSALPESPLLSHNETSLWDHLGRTITKIIYSSYLFFLYRKVEGASTSAQPAQAMREAMGVPDPSNMPVCAPPGDTAHLSVS